ncbi:MAG: hypothetical protein CL431_02770 [Acidimicrobiaceae bacterium]|jgi:hypothetical protein|nr:hypothetical protein [Acidimicrobiaceae bacterium]|tara:strand:+ start:65314 stop:65904 length:591 start_codon:yes stop_codon:yes gene_type:complete
MDQIRIKGFISSIGFSDGNRFVIGHWKESPIGEFGDIMWGTPTGEKILIAGNQQVANFVSAIYDFDHVQIEDLQTSSNGKRTEAITSNLKIDISGGLIGGVLPSRPLAFTKFIENPFASLLMGVNTYGISSRGVEEWYQAKKWRWVKGGTVNLNGANLKSRSKFTEPLDVGFSEPPRKSAIVEIHVTIRFPFEFEF